MLNAKKTALGLVEGNAKCERRHFPEPNLKSRDGKRRRRLIKPIKT